MNEATLEAEAPAQPTSQAEDRVATLTAHDRCDSCGAQAYVSILFEVGELSFCGHHAAAFWDKFSDKAVKIVDERWQLDGARLDVSA